MAQHIQITCPIVSSVDASASSAIIGNDKIYGIISKTKDEKNSTGIEPEEKLDFDNNYLEKREEFVINIIIICKILNFSIKYTINEKLIKKMKQNEQFNSKN